MQEITDLITANKTLKEELRDEMLGIPKKHEEYQAFNTLEDAINQALHEAFMKKIKEEKK